VPPSAMAFLLNFLEPDIMGEDAADWKAPRLCRYIP
jgi:hypothetical protein